MLVFGRKVGERVRLGDDIVVTVLKIQGDRVRLGFEGPAALPMHREEVWARIKEEERNLGE